MGRGGGGHHSRSMRVRRLPVLLCPCALSILHDENIVEGCRDGPYMSMAASCPSPSCFLSGGGDQARDAGVFRESAFCSLGHARYTTVQLQPWALGMLTVLWDSGQARGCVRDGKGNHRPSLFRFARRAACVSGGRQEAKVPVVGSWSRGGPGTHGIPGIPRIVTSKHPLGLSFQICVILGTMSILSL